ncbi:hypothetical protein ACFL27_28865, partial [candidate division CSSED10-310 bacterium]
FLSPFRKGRPEQEQVLPEKFLNLIQAREEARLTKDWKKSDQIRDTLKEQGIILEDTLQGTRWKRISSSPGSPQQ